MASRFWFVCHFSVAGLSYEILARREKCSAVDQSGHGHSRSQEAHFPNHCQCFDAKTVTPTFVSTSAIPEFPWIQRGVDLQFQQSHVAVLHIIPEILEFQRLLPYRITIQMGKSSQVVLSSHQQPLLPLQREAARNAMAVRRQQSASRACRSANCNCEAILCNKRCQKLLCQRL